MTRIYYILGILLTTLALGLTGAYVLWQFHTTTGLVIGVVLVVLAIAVALPAQLRKGAQELKRASSDLHDATAVVLPALEDDLRTGDRHIAAKVAS